MQMSFLSHLAPFGLAVALLAGCAATPEAPTALLTPPPDAQKFAIVSAAGQHGTAWRWQAADGSDIVRETIVLRGRTSDQEMVTHIGADGRPDRITVRGRTPSGDSAETFTIANGTAQWTSQMDSGRVPDDGRSVYLPAGGTWVQPRLFEVVLRAPGGATPLLPGGRGRVSRLVDVEVGSGPTAKTVTSWALEGVAMEPMLFLLEADGRFFGWAGGTMGALPEAYAGDRAKIQQAQSDALAARAPTIAWRFLQTPASPVAFTHVRLFDAEGTRFVEDQTVVVAGGRIAAVGPAAAIPVPAGARTIDGRGHTLVPGLWDAHLHAGSDQQGAMLLSMGETSARDPGADLVRSPQRAARIARGELLYPVLHSSLLIDRKGPNAAQLGTAVATESAAVEAVRLAKERGYVGVKLYGSLDPRWVHAIAAEARRLGLHVHGHVPATMRPRDAIAAGYGEITHINFVLMQAMPDDVVNASNGIARFQGPGRLGKDVDLDGDAMASVVRDMAAGGIAVDPTLVVYEGLLTVENGQVAPAYAPFLGTMPPAVERSFREGGDAPPPGVTREDYRASFRKMLALTRRLHDAGVPIVAGTDGPGVELVRELELYVQAGLTPAQALRTATLNPARLVGADREKGSVAVGKRADLVLVEGDPSRDIGALRQTRWVMLGGALMDADALRDLSGFSGRPR